MQSDPLVLSGDCEDRLLFGAPRRRVTETVGNSGVDRDVRKGVTTLWTKKNTLFEGLGLVGRTDWKRGKPGRPGT